MITLKNAQAKLDKRKTTRGFKKVCNDLTWPIEGPDVRRLLRDIRRDAKILQFALTIDSSGKVSRIAGELPKVLSESRGYDTVLFLLQCIECPV